MICRSEGSNISFQPEKHSQRLNSIMIILERNKLKEILTVNYDNIYSIILTNN